jgi:hypothetical protein
MMLMKIRKVMKEKNLFGFIYPFKNLPREVRLPSAPKVVPETIITTMRSWGKNERERKLSSRKR